MGLFSKLKRKAKPESESSVEIMSKAFNEEDYAKTLHLAREFGNQGDPYGWNFEAVLYEFGLGVNKNPDRAFGLYRKSANAGNVTGAFELAKRIWSGEAAGSEEEAIRLMTKAAEADYPTAACQLGKMFFSNYGGLDDDQKAFALFKDAYDSKDQESYPYYGYCLVTGTGTKEDPGRGRVILMASALNGNGIASAMLEGLYPGWNWKADYEKELKALEGRPD